MRFPILMVFVVAACGSSSNNNKVDADTTKHDAKVWMDAPPNVPAMITISGTTQEQGQGSSNPIAGASVAVFARGNDTTPLGTATSDAQGKYSIKIATNNMVVDGYIKTTASGHTDNYSFPSIPWQADDTHADPQLITTGNYGGLSLLLGRSAGQGLVVVNVTDASGAAVEGASISTDPAAPHYAYMDPSSGIPNASLPSTAADGLAFASGVTAGNAMLSADKAGATFKAHMITVHGDAFTTTSITQ